MIGGIEHRTFATQLSTRDINGMEGVVEGYASMTECPYDMGSYTESIARGAFTSTLSKNPDVQLLINHEGLPLARTTLAPGHPGHLALSEDGNGLHFRALLDKSDPDAATLLRKIGSGLLDQCSFAFRTVGQTWSADRSEREINEVSLDRGDVSVVNFGANPNTPVAARSRSRRGKGNLSLYQARARTRHLSIVNDAGRR
jgi:HK97 family phage prohead protease